MISDVWVGGSALIRYFGYDLRWVGGYISQDPISDKLISDFKISFHVFDLNFLENCDYLSKKNFFEA